MGFSCTFVRYVVHHTRKPYMHVKIAQTLVCRTSLTIHQLLADENAHDLFLCVISARRCLCVKCRTYNSLRNEKLHYLSVLGGVEFLRS